MMPKNNAVVIHGELGFETSASMHLFHLHFLQNYKVYENDLYCKHEHAQFSLDCYLYLIWLL